MCDRRILEMRFRLGKVSVEVVPEPLGQNPDRGFLNDIGMGRWYMENFNSTSRQSSPAKKLVVAVQPFSYRGAKQNERAG